MTTARFMWIYAHASTGSNEPPSPKGSQQHCVVDTEHPDAEQGQLMVIATCNTKESAKMIAMTMNSQQVIM